MAKAVSWGGSLGARAPAHDGALVRLAMARRAAGEFDKVAEKLAELEEKIAERERERRIAAAFADRLREALSEIDAALGG